jgi:hypothetical protein
MTERCSFVAGPVWQDEEGYWITEVQVSGGHEVAATLYAESKQEVECRRDTIIAVMNAQGGA